MQPQAKHGAIWVPVSSTPHTGFGGHLNLPLPVQLTISWRRPWWGPWGAAWLLGEGPPGPW